MPLFDFFKKRKSAPEFVRTSELPQLCYDIAYYILPQYAYLKLDRLNAIVSDEDTAGLFFYTMICNKHGIKPDPEVGRTLRWHTGTFPDGSTHLTLEYPTPPPVILDIEKIILAPYFSSVIETKKGAVGYFILGQSPVGGVTLRTITPDGVNANLGPGPAPKLDTFLKWISPENGEGFEVVAAVGPSR
ncbi:MAG: hypothetical protein QM758_18020 [Armatimonas sp.]